MGTSYPFEGNAYVGLCLYKEPERTYREYLAVKLLEPLKGRISYQLEFVYKVASLSNLGIDSIQMLFTKDSIFLKSNQVIRTSLNEHMLSTNLKNDPQHWLSASISFIATGKEHYLHFGNFVPDSLSISDNDDVIQSMARDNSRKEVVAYYYFDEFRLTEIRQSVSSPENRTV